MSLTVALQQLEAAHEENARLAKENARLRAEVEEKATEHADLIDVAKSALDSCDQYGASLKDARAEVERLEREAEGWARVAGAAALRAYTTGAEVERLRLGIAELRAGILRGLAPGDGTEPEPMTEVSGVVACLDALTREGGEGS